MSCFRRSIVQAVFFTGLFCTSADAQTAARQPAEPLPPADVLKLLPIAPANWKMTASTATNSFSDWLKSSAARTFQYTPPPQPNASPPPVQTTRVTVTDTGYYPQFAAEFVGHRPGKENDVEKFLIGSVPAIRITRGPLEVLSVLLNGRFVIQVRAENQAARSTETWLRLVDTANIARQPAGGDRIPQPVTITRVDELHPDRNTSYPLSWASEEQQKQAAAQAEAEEQSKQKRP